jgi:hypothetical protein
MINPSQQRSIDRLISAGKGLAEINETLRRAKHLGYDPQLFAEIRAYARQRILDVEENSAIERETELTREWMKG